MGLVKWWRGVNVAAKRWEAEIDAKAPEWEATAKHATADGVRRALSSVEAAALSGIGAAVLLSHFGGQESLDRSTVALAHGLWFGLWGVSASRLVGVFMAATSAIGLWFGALPRRRGRIGLLLGVLFGLTGAFAGPLDFIVPAWLVLVSVTLLVTRRRQDQRGYVVMTTMGESTMPVRSRAREVRSFASRESFTASTAQSRLNQAAT